MPRPHCCRHVHLAPEFLVFKPAGVPYRQLETLDLRIDEFEALRLADMEGLYHATAAEQMGVSRPTFGRILESARRKVAEALVTGKAIQIEGGHVKVNEKRLFGCADCQTQWELEFGAGRPTQCPNCNSLNIHRQNPGGQGRGRGAGRGRQGGGRSGSAGGPNRGRARARQGCRRMQTAAQAAQQTTDSQPSDKTPQGE